jgi:hypothetical protein
VYSCNFEVFKVLVIYVSSFLCRALALVIIDLLVGSAMDAFTPSKFTE